MLQLIENIPCKYRIIMSDNNERKHWICTYDKYYIIENDDVCINCKVREIPNKDEDDCDE